MDNNKRKAKLVAEHPAAFRRCRDGAAATCDDVVAASRWGWTVVVHGDGGEPTLPAKSVRHEGQGWAKATYTGSSYWEVCEAKCRFDHCLPRLRTTPFIAASALGVD